MTSILQPLELPQPLTRLVPAAFSKEGADWDYGLKEIPNVYYRQGNFMVFQANHSDAIDDVLHLLEIDWETAYNTPIRRDWVMYVDQTPTEWQMGAIASHLVLQAVSTDGADYFGGNVALNVRNGNFVFTYSFADGTPPGAQSVDLYTFPVTQGRYYNLSFRILPHLTAGKVEMWLDGVLVASAYNVATAFSTSNFIFERGLYRWANSPFVTPIRVLHSNTRTGKFEFLG